MGAGPANKSKILADDIFFAVCQEIDQSYYISPEGNIMDKPTLMRDIKAAIYDVVVQNDED